MMNRIFVFSFFVCLLFVQATIHPYYVSTLDIDYRPDREALQIQQPTLAKENFYLAFANFSLCLIK